MKVDEKVGSYPVPSPLLIVVSGMSGVGKDSVLHELRQSSLPLEFIVTMTTRRPRPDERDGIHYTFVTRENFQDLIARGQLLEWASVYGNYYGPPKSAVREALNAGKDAILRVDVQGVRTIKQAVPDCVAIFLAAPSMTELEQRLRSRGTESETELDLRLKTAEEELKQLPLFDYIVFNRESRLDRAVAEIEAIITAEKRRVKPRRVSL